MTGQSFTVVVEYPNGLKKEKVAAIGGGAMTADQLAQQYTDVNAFPGAKKVSIVENVASIALPKTLVDALRSRARIAQSVRPNTPTPTVFVDGKERAAKLRSDKQAAFSPIGGDGVPSDIAASPAATSDAAKLAREIDSMTRSPEQLAAEKPAQPG